MQGLGGRTHEHVLRFPGTVTNHEHEPQTFWGWTATEEWKGHLHALRRALRRWCPRRHDIAMHGKERRDVLRGGGRNEGDAHALRGEQGDPGGYAAIGISSALMSRSGYQRLKMPANSPFNVRTRVCNNKCAPSLDHCICCFLQKRLLTTSFTVDSTK